MKNRHLNDRNELFVTHLIQNSVIKARWQTYAQFDGKLEADRKIVAETNLPMTTVKAARFYW